MNAHHLGNEETPMSSGESGVIATTELFGKSSSREVKTGLVSRLTGSAVVDFEVPWRGVDRRVLLCVGVDFAVCRAAWSMTPLGSVRWESMAVGSGGASSAMDASER